MNKMDLPGADRGALLKGLQRGLDGGCLDFDGELAPLQEELARFLEDSVRFYRCQLVISTHSPFLLSLRGARIYDLDARPVEVCPWTELEHVQAYWRLFRERREEFEKERE